MNNLFSVDLEDWYHFIGDPAAPLYELWDSCVPRVEQNTDVLLEILTGCRVTFFVLGYIAQRHPGLIKKIAAAGHEIACHGYRHEFVFTLEKAAFRRDITQTKKLLEDLTGAPCLGYRAPGFSIRQQDLSVLDIIREVGFMYDSSIFPAVRTAGGIKRFYPFPQQINTTAGPLLELPVSTSRVMGITTAFCGGGFFRFFPEAYIHRHIHLLNKQQQAAIVYIHPRDIDPEQQRLPLKPFNRFLYYYGLKTAKDKLQRLVQAFQWSDFAGFAHTQQHTLPVNQTFLIR